MAEKPESREVERISTLIRDEKEAALAAFRDRDFPGRVMKEWRAARREAPPAPQVRPVFVAAVALVLLVAAVSALLLVLRAPAPRGRPGGGVLASVLGALPGGATVARAEPAGRAEAGAQGSGGLTGSVLAAVTAEERTGREGGESVSPVPPPAAAPRLSLRRKMKILFGDRVIERALILLKETSKEV